MVQIIEEQKQPTFADRLSSGFAKLVQEGAVGIPQMMQQQQEGKKFKEQFGFELPEEGRGEFYKAFAKEAGKQPFLERMEAQKRQQKQEEEQKENQRQQKTTKED